jgi:hypothetical protein
MDGSYRALRHFVQLRGKTYNARGQVGWHLREALVQLRLECTRNLMGGKLELKGAAFERPPSWIKACRACPCSDYKLRKMA